jgi:hypothetical protein
LTHATQVSTFVYNLTVTENMFSPPGMDDIDYFVEGDLVKFWEFKSGGLTGTVATGTLDTIVSATAIEVTVGTSDFWGTGGTIAYDLVFQEDGGSLQADQYEYAFVADANGEAVTGDADEFV